MKIERIKKSFAAHGIEYCIVSSIDGYCLEKPAVRIFFNNDEFSRKVHYIVFETFAAAYRYCKKHGLLTLSRRI